MITRNTASDIWRCHDEIEKGEKLLADMAALSTKWPEQKYLLDSFGRERGLQLGIPSGESSHRLYNVSTKLALSVIAAHIANQKAALAEANERARIELQGGIA
jgi:hypothetical protein